MLLHLISPFFQLLIRRKTPVLLLNVMPKRSSPHRPDGSLSNALFVHPSTSLYCCMAATRLLLSKRTDRESPYDQTSERSPSPGSSQRESVGSPHMALTSSVVIPMRGSAGAAGDFFGPGTSMVDFFGFATSVGDFFGSATSVGIPTIDSNWQGKF